MEIELTSKNTGEMGSGIRSYASKENLEKGLKKYGISERRHIVCKTIEGRWTAVFTRDAQYTAVPALNGFFVFG